MNNQEASQQVVGGFELLQKTLFHVSDENLKDYFLKEAVLLMPDACTPNRTEKEILIMFYKKLKLSVDFLGSLVAVPWDLAIPNLHEVCIPYLMRQDIPVNERNHVSHKLTEHLRFLSRLNGKKQIAKDLFNYYRKQSENLKRVLDKNFADWEKEEV